MDCYTDQYGHVVPHTRFTRAINYVLGSYSPYNTSSSDHNKNNASDRFIPDRFYTGVIAYPSKEPWPFGRIKQNFIRMHNE